MKMNIKLICYTMINQSIKKKGLMYMCACVTVLILGQWSSPVRPPRSWTETDPLDHSEHPSQTQSGKENRKDIKK